MMLQRKKSVFTVAGNHKFKEVDCIHSVQSSLKSHPRAQHIDLSSVEQSLQNQNRRRQLTTYFSQDSRSNRAECTSCETMIPDWCGSCPSCGTKFPVCVVTGRITFYYCGIIDTALRRCNLVQL